MRDDLKPAASYGAIEGEGDVEATPLEGDRARATDLVRGRKRLGLGLVAVACVGALARTRAMFTASLGSAPLVPALGLEDGAYYARGGKHRLRDPWLRINGANVPMSSMTEEQKSANVVNWCRFAETQTSDAACRVARAKKTAPTRRKSFTSARRRRMPTAKSIAPSAARAKMEICTSVTLTGSAERAGTEKSCNVRRAATKPF